MDPELEAAKRAATGQLLFKAARLWNEAAIARMRTVTGADVTLAHTRLLPHISLDGSRATEIAQRAGITKQAAGRVIDDLERAGVVERIPDPADARAQLVRFTDAGRASLHVGLGVLVAMEGELAEVVGADRMVALRGILADLVDALEANAAGIGGTGP